LYGALAKLKVEVAAKNETGEIDDCQSVELVLKSIYECVHLGPQDILCFQALRFEAYLKESLHSTGFLPAVVSAKAPRYKGTEYPYQASKANMLRLL